MGTQAEFVACLQRRTSDRRVEEAVVLLGIGRDHVLQFADVAFHRLGSTGPLAGHEDLLHRVEPREGEGLEIA